MDFNSSSPFPEGVISFLDTDLYKLTMQCAVLKYYKDVPVTYSFTNRTPEKKLSRRAFRWLDEQIKKLGNISLSSEELRYLQTHCPYLSQSYLDFLKDFRLRPREQVFLRFSPVGSDVGSDAGSDAELGDIDIDIRGTWADTILYEIPILALTSEAYFKFMDTDWTYDGQEERAFAKGLRLLEAGCVFSEFGTRRRRDYHTQALVFRGLVSASREAASRGLPGKLAGTSNVHLAMRFGLAPVGTVAHEWFMGIAAITDDYRAASEEALRRWVGCFGEGVLGIALTDTFGTPEFLRAFRLPVRPVDGGDGGDNDRDAARRRLDGRKPSVADSFIAATPEGDGDAAPTAAGPGVGGGGSSSSGSGGSSTTGVKTYAHVFTGVRQDSGDPTNFVRVMRQFYDELGIRGRKVIVFSDSLNIERCLEYKKVSEEAGFQPTFGVGTYLTNDFVHPTTGKKSTPMNIVIKLSSAAGRPAVKISDIIGKNTGDKATVEKVKRELGYVEKEWKEGDETARWGKEGDVVAA